jgi:hypothetical protein
MTALVVGLGGALRSGKDAIADHLVANHGFVKKGMSDPLLEHALILDPYIPVNAHPARDMQGALNGTFIRLSHLVEAVGYVEAKTNPEVRRFMQQDGTEGGRNFHDENVWVNRAARAIGEHLHADRRVVLTGIRFPNELAMVTQFGGDTWWVSRPGLDSASSASAHASENGVDAAMFDHIITNDGSLEDLYDTVDRLMETL